MVTFVGLALLFISQTAQTAVQAPSLKPQILIPAPTTKPPRLEYDKVRDTTVCMTSEVKFRSASGFSYLAAYRYRGTIAVQPETVWINFYARRTSDSTDPNKDADVASWAGVTEVILRWAKDPETFRAQYEKIADQNDVSKSIMKVLGGRVFYEHLRFEVPVTKFYELAHAKELLIALGNHADSLGEKTLKPMRQLADSLPQK